ncbi:P-loop NTPase fold protein [Streptomyces ipomoeae]|uniref:P-loop NTPase fold protein n=1 Tax=Streptomyces ipomoeae TaxID=103232 RepID=UPI001147A2E3|nr:P-loop NTPase fold protein [Streptomyces ipomoeae]
MSRGEWLVTGSGAQDPSGISFTGWADPAEGAVYERTVDACLNDFRVKRRLGTRDGVTAEAVRTAMHTQPNIAGAMQPCADSYARYRRAVEQAHTVRTRLAQARAEVGIDVRTAIGWLALVASVVWLAIRLEPDPSFLHFGLTVAPLMFLWGPLLWWIDRRDRSRRNLRTQAVIIQQLVSLPFRARDIRAASRTWERDLQHNGVTPVVHRVIDTLLGPDPDSVFLPDRYDGLRAARDLEYVVPSRAALQLEGKLAILDGGTVAVCGPRGVGKSTLLDSALKEGDFAIQAHVPATYTPHDFLLSLCVDVCEQYIGHEKYAVPPLIRLSGFVRALRRAQSALRRLRRTAFFGIPAAVLVALGSFSTVRSLWREHVTTVRSWVTSAGHWCADLAREVWRGDNVGVGMFLTLIGLAVWILRHSTRWRRRLRATPRALSFVTALALFIVVPGSLLADGEIREHAGALTDRYTALLILLFLSPLILWLLGHGLETIHVKGRLIPAPRLFTPAALGCLACFVWLVRRNDDAVAIVLDPQNHARLVGIVAGSLLLFLGLWRPRPPEPPLVTRCRDQLYRLRTVQTTSAGVTSTVSPLASLGSAHTSSLSSVPVNFPELVATFRTLLAEIARHLSVRGRRTIITIDELDRLGSAEQALAFLSEVKAIFGVPHVFYVVSVAEDVGAAFVRRGLPHRDSTDSSLDDVVHVQPCTLEESWDIIRKRAPGLAPDGDDKPRPYVLLAHGLSGGIPRDLIRYGRRIVEMQKEIGSVELTDISRHLVLEEVAETLAGFRTLLSGHQWTPANMAVLSRYRDLMDLLRSACDCRTDTVRQALEAFAAEPASAGSSAVDLPEEATPLIQEASAYAYFGLTLLQIFGDGSFDQRSTDAMDRAPEGHPRFLAEARLELGVSPHSARSLISDVRLAWGLTPVMTSALSPVVTPVLSPPRLKPCPLHPQG